MPILLFRELTLKPVILCILAYVKSLMTEDLYLLLTNKDKDTAFATSFLPTISLCNFLLIESIIKNCPLKYEPQRT